MTPRVKTWALATGVLLLYALAAWELSVVLRPRLQPSDLTLLRYGLMALGVLSAAVVLWFFRAPATPKTNAVDDVGGAMSQARARREGSLRPGRA